MGSDQNFRESNANVNSRLTICKNREIYERQFIYFCDFEESI